MARFRCRTCGEEGQIDYQPGLRRCPYCGSQNVQIAVSAAELPDDDPIIAGIRKLAEDNDDDTPEDCG